MKKNFIKVVSENLKTILYALLIAVLIRSLFFQPFYIPSSSMEPTLLIGDRIFVSKYSYGYSKHSFPFSPSIYNKRLLKKEPKYGDLVVFKTPADNRTDYIKRLIGLPGDEIQFRNGKLFINNNEIIRKELKIVEAAAHRLAKAKIIGQPVLSCWDAFLSYCQTTLAHRSIEEFRVLFLDRKNNLIADEKQGSGTVDHVPVYPREIIKQALQLNASALILVHNHPSGDPTPSSEDIKMTDEIVTAAAILGLIVHDHLVIGKCSEFSFRSGLPLA